MQELHRLTLKVSPRCKLWFSDGKDSKGRTVSNPTIGYGLRTIEHANETSREFFRIGVSGNKTGVSIYLIGLKDKKYLAKAYGKTLGKASHLELELGMLRPGIRVMTSPTDFQPIKQLSLIRFDGKEWSAAGPIVRGK